MILNLNNREEFFESDSLNVSELMIIKKFSYPKIIVKVNDHLIEKEDFHSTYIKDGDKVVILHLLAGG
ncbi:MAG TPA: thiamine biosynthesis protein ThiS [Saprospirales bacterium]|nr:thiamine biosynthesis protein ThiS [Saprospirales bacterium]